MMDACSVEDTTEDAFPSIVATAVSSAHPRAALMELLREACPAYGGRGATAVSRMRGWVLLTLAQIGIDDDALPFVLEEFDAGHDPYLIAAAARAMRSYPRPTESLAPFVLRAINNVRFNDLPVSLDRYGEDYDSDATITSAVSELLAVVSWLGPHAWRILPGLSALRDRHTGLPRSMWPELDRAIAVVRAGGPEDVPEQACCALSSLLGFRRHDSRAARDDIRAVQLEDQDGHRITFGDFLAGGPAIIIFFYTRCDNPLKCSVSVTKLAHVQHLLARRELSSRIRTAAITYDAGYDQPDRLRRYGLDRGVQFDGGHRMLRAIGDAAVLRSHFELGVNYGATTVNRHQIEAYLLDQRGRVAASFTRLQWSEADVVDQAVSLLGRRGESRLWRLGGRTGLAASILTPLVSLAVALFPKCPACWAGYLSVFGLTMAQSVTYSPWLIAVLAAGVAVNLALLWWFSRQGRGVVAFSLAAAGAIALGLKVICNWTTAGYLGVGLTMAASVWIATHRRPS